MNRTENINLNDHLFYLIYKKFFEARSIQQHLIFIEEWMELVLSAHKFEGKYSPADLLFYYQLLVELYEASHQFLKTSIKQPIEELIVITPGDTRTEAELFGYAPSYMSSTELVRPSSCFAFLHDEEQLRHYKNLLFLWLQNSLEQGEKDCAKEIIFPLFSKSKKLIEACWLIYRRLSKLDNHNGIARKINRFEDTCPLLLKGDNLINPYLEIIDFYSGYSLNRYRNELKKWFRAAMNEGVKAERVHTIAYFHDQLICLIQAGYFIVKDEILYEPYRPYSSNAETFGDWIRLVKEDRIVEDFDGKIQYEILVLEEADILDPFNALKIILTLENIVEIRYGLREWLQAALNTNDSINAENTIYTFELFEKLERLLELFFLLVAANSFEVAQEKEDLEDE